MKNKVTILVSPSGGGKSTFTKSYVESNPFTVVCNRDSLRRAIHPNQKDWYKRLDLYKLEALVTELEYLTFSEALENGYDVLIDNTNLKQSVINKFILRAENHEVPFFFKIIDVPKDICKRNVLCRDFNYAPAIDNLVYKKEYTLNHVEIDSCEEVAYIDKQYEDFLKIKPWIETNYKDKLL